jgi:hypothetical protein
MENRLRFLYHHRIVRTEAGTQEAMGAQPLVELG